MEYQPDVHTNVAYASDYDYRHETMEYQPDVHTNVDHLMQTCSMWRDLIHHNWDHFLKMQRRSHYLSTLSFV